MDSSSIVSFNNDSTYQTTLKGDFNNVSVHELALHAMRDRCLLLQRRINTLENDNMKLKIDISNVNVPYLPLQDDEKSRLRQQIAELNKQKSQLIHHVFMVSCENKNLWNKISTLKSQDKFTKEITKQPLLRANAYNTPKSSANYQEKYSESSLEEISLKLINSYIQEKSQLVEQYEQMSQLQEMDDDILNVDSIGFTYMEDSAFDSLKEIHNQTEKLQKMKKELVQQESDLKLVISKLESVLLEGYKCPTCMSNNSRTMSTENKEVETSGSLLNLVTPMQSTNYNNYDESNSSVGQNNLENDLEVTIEHYDKICPMCGQTFTKSVDFSEFQSHVEQHFIGENEMDSLTDNIENTPNSFENVS